MKYKKKTKAVMFAGGLLILTVVSVFATTSRANEVPSGADAGIPEESRDASIPMDPPEGILGSMSEPELDGADGAPGRDADPGADLQTEGTVPSAENLSGSSGNEESGYRLVYVKEGFPESEPAQLVTGQGFRLLIPLEGWTSFGPDGWMSEINNEVEIWGACFTSEGSDYEGFDREQIVAALQKEGYQEDNGSYWRNEEGRMMTVELRQTNDQDIWGIFYTYPEEGEDGWGVELRAMAQTFTALSPEAPEVRSGAEGEAAGREWKSFTRRLENENAVMALLGDFMDAAGGKDHDAVLQYVAEGAEAETECLDWIREWKQEEISLQFQPEEDYCTASIQVVTNDNDGSSNEYLTVEMVKEAEGWKISWMGIEK